MQATGASGGVLSGLGGSSGILAKQKSIFQARMATVQAATTPQAKISALMATLGTRAKGGILSGVSSGTSGGTTTSAGPVYASGINMQTGPTEDALKKAFQTA